MRTILLAIHGILTNQTNPSWPDQLDAWMYRHAPELKVLKKEYRAGPFPRWNCWFKDPLLAASAANELELLLAGSGPNRSAAVTVATPQPSALSSPPSLWLVAHSNGAVIALQIAKRLIARGHRLEGLLLTGAACEADIAQNGILTWLQNGALGAAIAYCSPDDQVLAGDPLHASFRTPPSPLRIPLGWLWGKLMWPYGCLGRTGFLYHGQPFDPATCNLDPAICHRIHHRWFPGGHSSYFKPQHRECTFEQIYQDITRSPSEFGLLPDLGPQPSALSSQILQSETFNLQ